MNPTALFTAESSPSTERVAPRKSLAEGKRRHPFRASLSYFFIAVLIISAGSNLAKGASPAPPNAMFPAVTLWSGNTTASPDSTVRVFVNITHGETVASSNGGYQAQGYVARVFWGQANSTGDINESTVVIPASAIQTPTYYCLNGPIAPCYGNVSINVTHVYNRTGSYVVSATVYDANLNFMIQTIQINVTRAPLFLLGHCTPPSGFPHTCHVNENQNVELNGQACNVPINSSTGFCPQKEVPEGLLWNWSFGDGTFGHGRPNPYLGQDTVNHYYNQEGTYDAWVTASDPSTGYIARDYVQVVVANPTPTISCIKHPGNASIGLPVNLSVQAFDNPITGPNQRDTANLSFNWTFGDGTYAWGRNYTSHIYTTGGTFYPSVRSVDEDGLDATQAAYCMAQINVTAASLPHGGNNTRAAVGNYAFLTALNATGVPPSTPFVNYTWSAPQGPSWGWIGKDQSFRPGNKPATVTASGTYLGTLTNSSNVYFYDVKPTVGIDSLYTEATITLSVADPYYYDYLNFTLLENGVDAGWYNMSYPTSSVTFEPLDFQMSNRWTIDLQYTPYGHSGGTSVNVGFSWTKDNTYVDGYDATEPSDFSDTVSVSFSNSNTSSQNNVPISVNYQALGEPAFGYGVLFSPAQTNLTETVNYGDGTVDHYTDRAPTQMGPTMFTFPLSHAWTVGSNYVLNWTVCDDYNLCGSDVITINQTSNFTASDTAPFVSLPAFSGARGAGQNITFNATVTNQNQVHGNTSTVKWEWGDGTTTVGNPSVHMFVYSGKYAVVVIATSPGGSATANWTWITIKDIAPNASFTTSPSTGSSNGDLVFNATMTAAPSYPGARGLEYSWSFGDGVIAGGIGLSGAVVSHNYQHTGSYMVSLTASDLNGQSSSVSHMVSVTTPVPSVKLANRTLLDDRFYEFGLNLSLPPVPTPFLNFTWSWGDGTSNSYGIAPGHSYFGPPSRACSCYFVNATVKGWPFTTPVTVMARMTVVDQPSLINFPYQGGYLDYGENHTALFSSMAIGTSADVSPAFGNNNYQFVWSWGDGTPNTVTTGTNLSSVGHQYITTGIYQLDLTITGPYGNVTEVSTQITSVPDYDGDGVPVALEATLGFKLFQPAPGVTTYYGTGLTNFLGQYLPNLGPLTRDPGHCGETMLQAILGSVTGFQSNPLDCNPAGDGVPTPDHFFTDTFSASTSVPFTTNNCSVQIQIPDVVYPGGAASFNDSKLLVEINTAEPLSDFNVVLTDPQGGLLGNPSQSYYLPQQSTASMVWDLMNSTPNWGPKIHVPGMSLGLLMSKGTWTVTVFHNQCSTPNSLDSGNVSQAVLSIAYYTNPNKADPQHQGMLEGPTEVTPVFNCSEPHDVNYTVFNPSVLVTNPSAAFTTVYFWPYTEMYYKLSVAQGVPYSPQHNSSEGIQNNGTYNISGSPCTITSAFSHLSGPPSFASADAAAYLGDKDFGISPDNAHFAGDPVLTNGMKALGAAVYNQTWGHYISTSGGWTTNGVSYPGDNMNRYYGPLNPVAFSTAGDGIPDSQAVDPYAALALGVTITGATDPYCYEGGAGTVWTVQDQLSASVTSNSNPNYYFTNTYRPNGGGGSCPSGNGDFTYGFNESFLMPVDTNTWTYTEQFSIWNSNYWLFTSPTDNSDETVSGSMLPWSVATGSSSSNGGTITTRTEVIPLTPAPTILVNSTNETPRIPGYGYFYKGEQDFFAFELNVYGGVAGGSDPFQNGMNVILIPRTDLFASPFNNTITGGHVPSNACYGNATVTSRGSSPSTQGVVGTFIGNVTDACANSILTQLLPLNVSGNVDGAYEALTTQQLLLLGLSTDVLSLVPLTGVAYFTDQSQQLQKTAWGTIAGELVSVFSFVAQLFVAIGVKILFFALSHLFGKKFAQEVLGSILNNPLVQQAMQTLDNVFDGIWNAIVAFFTALYSDLENSFIKPVQTLLVDPWVCAVLSDQFNNGYLPTTSMHNSFNEAWDNVTGNPLGTVPPAGCLESPSAVSADESKIILEVIGFSLAVMATAIAVAILGAVGSFGLEDAADTAGKVVAKPTIERVAEQTAGVGISLGGAEAAGEVLSDLTSSNSAQMTSDLEAIGIAKYGAQFLGNALKLIAKNQELQGEMDKLTKTNAVCFALTMGFSLDGMLNIALANLAKGPPAFDLFIGMLSVISGAVGLACLSTPEGEGSSNVPGPGDQMILGLGISVADIFAGFGEISIAASKCTDNTCL